MRLPEQRERPRLGQFWKKRDTGRIIEITGTCGDRKVRFRPFLADGRGGG